MASFDVTALNTQVASDFAALKANADNALQQLSQFANFNAAGTYYNLEKNDNNYLYSDNEYIPIEVITVADDTIAKINVLADQISSVNFVPPNAITNFQMEDHKIWQDALADKIESNISSYITSMGIPDVSYQNAIFNESYDRNLQTLNDLLDLADTKVGARGFTYPNGMVTALKLDAQQKYQFDRNQVNRDITKLVTEWARENYQFAIDKGIAFEQFHADFTYKYCTAFVDIYKNMILASIERFKADISKFVEPIKALIEAAKFPLEVAKINADIEKANAEVSNQSKDLQIKESTAMYGTRMQAAIATFEYKLKALEAVAQETAKFIQAASRSVIGVGKG